MCGGLSVKWILAVMPNAAKQSRQCVMFFLSKGNFYFGGVIFEVTCILLFWFFYYGKNRFMRDIFIGQFC